MYMYLYEKSLAKDLLNLKKKQKMKVNLTNTTHNL